MSVAYPAGQLRRVEPPLFCSDSVAGPHIKLFIEPDMSPGLLSAFIHNVEELCNETNHRKPMRRGNGTLLPCLVIIADQTLSPETQQSFVQQLQQLCYNTTWRTQAPIKTEINQESKQDDTCLESHLPESCLGEGSRKIKSERTNSPNVSTDASNSMFGNRTHIKTKLASLASPDSANSMTDTIKPRRPHDHNNVRVVVDLVSESEPEDAPDQSVRGRSDTRRLGPSGNKRQHCVADDEACLEAPSKRPSHTPSMYSIESDTDGDAPQLRFEPTYRRRRNKSTLDMSSSPTHLDATPFVDTMNKDASDSMAEPQTTFPPIRNTAQVNVPSSGTRTQLLQDRGNDGPDGAVSSRTRGRTRDSSISFELMDGIESASNCSDSLYSEMESDEEYRRNSRRAGKMKKDRRKSPTKPPQRHKDANIALDLNVQLDSTSDDESDSARHRRLGRNKMRVHRARKKAKQLAGDGIDPGQARDDRPLKHQILSRIGDLTAESPRNPSKEKVRASWAAECACGKNKIDCLWGTILAEKEGDEVESLRKISDFFTEHNDTCLHNLVISATASNLPITQTLQKIWKRAEDGNNKRSENDFRPWKSPRKDISCPLKMVADTSLKPISWLVIALVKTKQQLERFFLGEISLNSICGCVGCFNLNHHVLGVYLDRSGCHDKAQRALDRCVDDTVTIPRYCNKPEHRNQPCLLQSRAQGLVGCVLNEVALLNHIPPANFDSLISPQKRGIVLGGYQHGDSLDHMDVAGQGHFERSLGQERSHFGRPRGGNGEVFYWVFNGDNGTKCKFTLSYSENIDRDEYIRIMYHMKTKVPRRLPYNVVWSALSAKAPFTFDWSDSALSGSIKENSLALTRPSSGVGLVLYDCQLCATANYKFSLEKLRTPRKFMGPMRDPKDIIRHIFVCHGEWPHAVKARFFASELKNAPELLRQILKYLCHERLMQHPSNPFHDHTPKEIEGLLLSSLSRGDHQDILSAVGRSAELEWTPTFTDRADDRRNAPNRA